MVLCYAVICMIGVLCFGNIVFAAESAHVHEYGSMEMVERVYFVDSVIVLLTYEKDGHTYEYQQVTEWCKFYRECYCGARGQYRDGGRTYTRDVMID